MLLRQESFSPFNLIIAVNSTNKCKVKLLLLMKLDNLFRKRVLIQFINWRKLLKPHALPLNMSADKSVLPF